jgi:hypothetical protein
MRIAGCTVAGPIHESSTKIVYRAVDEISSTPVVPKVLLGAYPSPGEGMQK